MDHADSHTTADDPIIDVVGASVTFDMDRGESRVLDDVSLTVARQEAIGIVGESGSGKSMLASAMVNAVVDPGRLMGTVYYYPEDGKRVEITALEDDELNRLRWRHLAFVIQGAQSAFNPTMSIDDHFLEVLREHDADVEEGLERARELLRDVHLDPDLVMGSYPHELSGGMKQRALIALGLVLEPEVLIMDEPTAALDLLMQRSIVSLLAGLREKYDLTMLFITHDLPLVSDLADRIAVMYAFQLVEVGDTQDVLRHSAHPYTRALLNSVPHLDGDVSQMTSIPGSSPNASSVPTGCSYHPRCPLADEQCELEDPPLYDVQEGQVSACHYWESVAERVPLAYEEAIE